MSVNHRDTRFSYDAFLSGKFFEEVYNCRLGDIKDAVIYTGDSPNDEPMFSYFPHAVGVANVRQFESLMVQLPTWVTEGEGGYGFAEMVDLLLT